MDFNLAIIIVTYNSRGDIGKCLSSLANINIKYTAFVSDNNSCDDTVAISIESGAVVLENKANLGYSKAINKVFDLYIDETYTHLLILNPDTYFESELDFIDLIKSSGVKDLTSIKMINKDGEKRINTFYFPCLWNIALARLRFNKRASNKMCSVDSVEGSFMLVSCDVFKALDGFDDNIFLYGEDYEFCYRVKENGGSVVFNPKYSYVHDGGFTSQRKVLPIKGQIYFFKKHKGLFTYLFASFFLKLKLRLIGRYV